MWTKHHQRQSNKFRQVTVREIDAQYLRGTIQSIFNRFQTKMANKTVSFILVSNARLLGNQN
jgi:hypothetical protein